MPEESLAADISSENTAQIPVHAEICKTMKVDISGSLKRFALGGHGSASWFPQNGKLSECFGISELLEHAADAQTVSNMLSKCNVLEVKVLDIQNNLPVAVGMTCSVIPPREVTSSGHQYAITCGARTSNQTPCTIFKAAEATEESTKWRQLFPQYNTNNLETHNVLTVTGQPYVFVDQFHPVIQLLKDNADILNADITQQPLIDGRWYKMTRQVLSSCSQTLRQKVLHNCNASDLNSFSIQIHRLNGQDWTQLSTNDELMSHISDDVLIRNDEAEIGAYIEHLQNRRGTFSMRMEITYELFSAPTARA